MNIKFKEDKNGKIADNDSIFDTLNEQIDNEEYAAVVSKITVKSGATSFVFCLYARITINTILKRRIMSLTRWRSFVKLPMTRRGIAISADISIPQRV